MIHDLMPELTTEQKVELCLELVGILANDPAMPAPFWDQLLELRVKLEEIHIQLRDEELGA